jgi:hypothetical protein
VQRSLFPYTSPGLLGLFLKLVAMALGVAFLVVAFGAWMGGALSPVFLVPAIWEVQTRRRLARTTPCERDGALRNHARLRLRQLMRAPRNALLLFGLSAGAALLSWLQGSSQIGPGQDIRYDLAALLAMVVALDLLLDKAVSQVSLQTLVLEQA